jgi:hypothetical protein
MWIMRMAGALVVQSEMTLSGLVTDYAASAIESNITSRCPRLQKRTWRRNHEQRMAQHAAVRDVRELEGLRALDVLGARMACSRRRILGICDLGWNAALEALMVFVCGITWNRRGCGETFDSLAKLLAHIWEKHTGRERKVPNHNCALVENLVVQAHQRGL